MVGDYSSHGVGKAAEEHTLSKIRKISLYSASASAVLFTIETTGNAAEKLSSEIVNSFKLP